MEKKVYNQEETPRDNRKVEEAGVAYGACPEAAVHSFEKELPWLEDFLAHLPEGLAELENPTPYTREELRSRVVKATIGTSFRKGISPEELFRRMDMIAALWKRM